MTSELAQQEAMEQCYIRARDRGFGDPTVSSPIGRVGVASAGCASALVFCSEWLPNLSEPEEYGGYFNLTDHFANSRLTREAIAVPESVSAIAPAPASAIAPMEDTQAEE